MSDTNKNNNKSKTKLFLLIGLILVILISVGITGFLYHKKQLALKEQEDSQMEDDEPPSKVIKKKKKDKFFELKSEFHSLGSYTTNLKEEEHFIRVEFYLEYKAEDSKLKDTLKLYQPAISHKIIMLLTQAKTKDILSQEGKEELAQAVLDAIEETVPEDIFEHAKLEKILYYDIVVQ